MPYKLLIFSLLTFSIGFSQSSIPIFIDSANHNTTINSCEAIIYDSGQSGSYSNDEIYTITICPDSNSQNGISIEWIEFNLDTTNTAPFPNNNADHLIIYDGSSTLSPVIDTFYFGDIDSADMISASYLNFSHCLTLSFISNDSGTGNFQANVSCGAPCDLPNANAKIVNASNTSGDSIFICPGSIVGFLDNGSTAGSTGLFSIEKWVWIWSDGSPNDTLLNATDTVYHTFNTPGMNHAQLSVTNNFGCSNIIDTALRIITSPLPNFTSFPKNDTLCLGENYTLIAQPNQYVDTIVFDSKTCSNSLVCFPDITGVIQFSNIAIQGFDPSFIIHDTSHTVSSICLNMERSYVGDLVLQIQCPTGQIVTLHQQGGGGTNLGIPVAGAIDCMDQNTFGEHWEYNFTNLASQTWVQAINAGNTINNTLLPGNYLPVDTNGFSGLNGCPINGVWSILHTDIWGSDDGSMSNFCINFSPSAYDSADVIYSQIGNSVDSSFWNINPPEIISSSPDLNTINMLHDSAGTYSYTYSIIDNFGCEFDTSVNITIAQYNLDSLENLLICPGEQIEIGPDLEAFSDSCLYKLILTDNMGDGWDINNIDVTYNGLTTNYYGPLTDSVEIDIILDYGNDLTLTFNSLSNNAVQCAIYLYSTDGSLVYSNGDIGFPTPLPHTFTANCSTPFGYPNLTYEWTPNDNTISADSIIKPIVSPIIPTTYYLSYYPTGHPGCIISDSVFVDIGLPIDAGNDTLISFCNDTAQINLLDYLSGNYQANGTWFTSNFDSIPNQINTNSLNSGNYFYIVYGDTSLNICQLSDTAIFTITNSEITANWLLDSLELPCDDNDLGAAYLENIVSNHYPININWFNSNTIFSTDSLYQTGNSVKTNLPPGNWVIEITDTFNCTSTFNLLLNTNDSLYFSNLTSDPFSSTNDGNLYSQATGGTPPYNYLWTNLTDLSMVNTSDWLNVIAGDYGIIVTDSYGCSINDTLTVDWLSISNHPFNQLIKVYPSLVTDSELNIISEIELDNHVFKIFDLNGKQVFKQTITANKTTIPLTLSNGNYVYKVESLNKSTTISSGKLVILLN